MKITINCFIAAILFSFCAGSIAKTQTNTLEKFYQYPISSGVTKLMQQSLGTNVNNIHLGIIIESMRTGKILYQRDANQLFAPASVLKLFTATAGLAYLKPDYQFSTQVYRTGTLRNHVLNGDVIFKFNGDPTFKTKDLNQLIHALFQAGIQTIKGHIYIDNYAFNNTPAYPPGWIWDDLSYSYAAPLNAIVINENKFVLRFKPADTLGRAPELTSSLPPKVATFTNHMQTTQRFYKNCPVAIYSNNLNQYTVTGCLNQKWGEQRRSLAIRAVLPYARALIREGFQQQQIHYTGDIVLHILPKNARLIATHNSKPLSVITKKMLKNSDNLMTNAIFKKIGEQYSRDRGTWTNSIHAEEKILQNLTQINFKHNLINDGAGLSRYNLVTPQQLNKLLNFAYQNQIIKPVLMNALPIAGIDGTLIQRMLQLARHKRIHAKTGSMTGVASLAGYVDTKHNGLLSFVIMINGFVGKRTPYIRFEDKVCEYLVNAPTSTHRG